MSTCIASCAIDPDSYRNNLALAMVLLWDRRIEVVLVRVPRKLEQGKTEVRARMMMPNHTRHLTVHLYCL